MAEVTIGEFFELEFPNFAMYNAYRMLASYIDGMKPSHRKVAYTSQKNRITSPIKVN